MDLFPDTKWTMLAQATLNGDDSGGVYSGRVEDVRQDFFVSLMKGSFFKKANSEHGKFRSFLLSALKRFLADDYRRLSAAKRGGGLQHVEIEDDSASTETDNIEFDLVWAETLFESAQATVGEEIKKKRGESAWGVLKNFLTGDSDKQNYDTLANVLDLSVGGAKAEVSRMRSKFRKQLRLEVGLTVSAPHEIDEELRYLKEAMIRVWGVKNA